MSHSFDNLVQLIRELTRTLADLTETQRDVAAAVRTDDLAALGECMKKENVLSLALRNLDQKRARLQKEMGLAQIRLAELPDRAPDEKTRQTARQAAEALKNQYRIMQSAAEVARSALECSLHEVEGMMTKMGIDPRQAEVQTMAPGGVHTDFHA